MADLIERLRERAEFEDKRVLDEAKAIGFVPEVYSGSQTGALLREAAAALEAARGDAERYRWLRECAWLHQEAAPACAIFGVDGSMLRSIDGSDLDAAIDQARGTASEAKS
jgi:hypothetical protein